MANQNSVGLTIYLHWIYLLKLYLLKFILEEKSEETTETPLPHDTHV